MVLCDGNNLRLNESVVGAQLDTYRLHRQTSRCQAEREENGEKAVDTRVNSISDECIWRYSEQQGLFTTLLFTYCSPLQVDKATRELSFPLTWPW